MSLFESASLVVTPNGTKASKLYAIKPTSGAGDLSVTRATTATRVNASGLIESVANNVPRLDYTNSTCPSILVEPQRTNLVLNSEDFSNATWTKQGSIINTNSITSPNGTLTADKLVMANGQSGNSADGVGIRQLIDIGSNSYTFSIFAKAGEFSTIRFRENQVTGAFLTVNLLNGAITNGDSNQFINAKAELYSNGWYRVSFQTPTLTALYKYSVRVSETGDGTSGIYVWGFQAEAGSYATSYIPTTSASVTRNADVISKTGISSLIGQTEGTAFIDYIPKSNYHLAEQNLLTLYNSSSIDNNNIQFFVNSSQQIVIYVLSSGSVVANINTGVSALNSHKIALGYKANDLIVYIDGIQVGSDTSLTVPALNSIVLNNYAVGNYMSASAFKNVTLWKTKLTNEQLAQLTTI
jgi:hypothetical protein